MLSISSAKIIPAIFDFNGSGRLGRERKLHQGGVQQSKLRRDGDRGVNICLSPTPYPTIHSYSKSNMAGGINNCKLITLTHPYKMPALQAI